MVLRKAGLEEEALEVGRVDAANDARGVVGWRRWRRGEEHAHRCPSAAKHLHPGAYTGGGGAYPKGSDGEKRGEGAREGTPNERKTQ